MEEKNWMQILSGQNQLAKVIETNQVTEKFGLVLSEEDAKLLVNEKSESLKEQKRIEYGESILPKIIYEFCDSDYISQRNYVETIGRLQDIFFLYKNEMMDEISDDELLHFMKEQFETVCYGDLEYLESTCLDVFAQAIRAGYQGYHVTEGKSEYGKFDLVSRWNHEVYLEVLKELCWR
ncbi:MAG: DUF6323 family protein [Bariatricus sp.]|uniref:DUF6323 family protein n=1 Tax=Bariatricus sp. HCP3S3_E12 TaxID=3438906 RepID=UPI002A89F404|nr:DUF6323 family protein [Bariatricus sp.]